MINTPIIVVHTGCQKYLHVNINSILEVSSEQQVILIGDDSNKHLESLPGVKWLNKSDLAAESYYCKHLYQNYRHMAFTSKTFELMCFDRWPIILECLDKLGLDRFVHMDSDVFLLKPLDVIFSSEDFSRDASITVAPYAPWMAYFTLPMLKGFCEYIKYVFSLSDSSLLELVRKNTSQLQKRPLSAESQLVFNDMWALRDFLWCSEGSHAGRILCPGFPADRMSHSIVPMYTRDASINNNKFQRFEQCSLIFDGCTREVRLPRSQFLVSSYSEYDQVLKSVELYPIDRPGEHVFNYIHFHSRSKRLIDRFYSKLKTAIECSRILSSTVSD
jgi:hypothetical protein